LSDSDILDLWDRAVHRHPLDRALLMLDAGRPHGRDEALADWPLGRRNEALAQLRGACFGHAIHGWTSCPRCSEQLEFETDWRALAGQSGEATHDQPIMVGGRAYRVPTSRDLACVASEPDPHRAAIRLVENCRIEPDGAVAWSDDELADIGDKMARADPLAETRLSLSCPSCAHTWEESLDIAAFLWEEIDARARRILLEVHALAAAYGWHEAQILSLGPRRRAIYLEMVRA
jgi:hypothetical protein